MNTNHLHARITRAERKDLNPMLHAHGLPTLGAAHTLAEYNSTLTKAQKATFAGRLNRDAAPASTGHVRAKIAAHTALKREAAATLAEFAA